MSKCLLGIVVALDFIFYFDFLSKVIEDCNSSNLRMDENCENTNIANAAPSGVVEAETSPIKPAAESALEPALSPEANVVVASDYASVAAGVSAAEEESTPTSTSLSTPAEAGAEAEAVMGMEQREKVEMDTDALEDIPNVLDFLLPPGTLPDNCATFGIM